MRHRMKAHLNNPTNLRVTYVTSCQMEDRTLGEEKRTESERSDASKRAIRAFERRWDMAMGAGSGMFCRERCAVCVNLFCENVKVNTEQFQAFVTAKWRVGPGSRNATQSRNPTQ